MALVREMLMRQDAAGYARTCEALAAAQAVDLRSIRCPTLRVTGNDDPVAPPSLARQMADRIEGARVSILDRCGHWATFERALEVNRLLNEFYARGSYG